MKYRYTYVVQYQDVDIDRRLRLHTLENYLLNVAGQVADELGFGIPNLLPMGCTWIITRLNLEMRFLPTHGDTMVIETWIEQHIHTLSVRDYRIYLQQKDGTEMLLGCAKSVWAILDLEKREIANIFHLPMFDNVVDGEVLNIARPMRLLPIDVDAARQNPETLAADTVEHTIQYSDVDYNRHCNSCRYLEWMLNACTWHKTQSPLRLDINYVKELHLGQQMFTRFVQTSNHLQFQQLDAEGHTSCTAQISHIPNLSTDC